MKKILFVVSTLNTGGAQRAFANMSIALHNRGVECDFLLNDAEDISYPYEGNIIDLGLPGKKDKTDLLYQAQVLWRRFRRLKHLKATGEYCACISALTSANAVNVLTGRGGDGGLRTIVSIRNHMSRKLGRGISGQGSQSEKDRISGRGRSGGHGQSNGRGISGNLKSRIKAAMEGWGVSVFSKRADYCVCVSESIRRDMIDHFSVVPKRAVTIYNSYPIEKIRDMAKSDSLALNAADADLPRSGSPSNSRTVTNLPETIDNTRTLINIGRLSKQKGQLHLLRIFKRVHDALPDTRLVILGEGELRSDLEASIDALGLSECVKLLGFVKDPYPALMDADLFVMTSLYEGFPNTMAESLILGVPVVSTDCDSGPREILAPGSDISYKAESGYEKAEYGVITPVFTWDARQDEAAERTFAEAVIELLQDEELYEHYKRMACIRGEEFSDEKAIDKWMNLVHPV